MKKVFLFSLFLVLGLVLSQCLPVWLGEAFLTAEKVAKTLMFVCLAFIMINVGRNSNWIKRNGDLMLPIIL